jgi:Cell morphogenesis N-terminal
MEALAKAFENAHGFRFKLSFAETLVLLLHPVAQVLSVLALDCHFC